MECPDCGYVLSALDASCVRCERIGKPVKKTPPVLDKPNCTNCKAVVDFERTHCFHCGVPYTLDIKVQAKAFRQWVCSHCNYPNAPERKSCFKCGTEVQQPTETLPRSSYCVACGQSIQAGVSFCPHCGAAQKTLDQSVSIVHAQPPPVYTAQPHPVFVPTTPEVEPSPQTGAISAMWGLTILQILVMAVSGWSGFPIAFLLDIPAFIIAIVLACSRNATDKTNGWVKLSLEIMAAFIGMSAHRFY